MGQKSFEVTMPNLAKTTKGTYMYEVDSGDRQSFSTNLYVKKDAFNGSPPPKQIKVTVSWDDGE